MQISFCARRGGWHLHRRAAVDGKLGRSRARSIENFPKIAESPRRKKIDERGSPIRHDGNERESRKSRESHFAESQRANSAFIADFIARSAFPMYSLFDVVDRRIDAATAAEAAATLNATRSVGFQIPRNCTVNVSGGVRQLSLLNYSHYFGER